MSVSASQLISLLSQKILGFYIIVVLPAGAIYGSLVFLTDLRGKVLFQSFLPAALVLLIVYLFWLVKPLIRLGVTGEPKIDSNLGSAQPGQDTDPENNF